MELNIPLKCKSRKKVALKSYWPNPNVNLTGHSSLRKNPLGAPRGSGGKCGNTGHAAPGVVSSPSSSFVEPREGQPPLKKLKQGSLPLDRLSAAANSELQMDVCRFVVGANLPFYVVENGCFLHLLHKLRPGFRPPTRETISGEFLGKL